MFQHSAALQSHTLPDSYFEQRATLSAADLRAIQDEGVREQARLAWERVPFYRAKLKDAGLGPDDVRGVDDLAKVPFTTVDEIRPVPWEGYTTEQIVAAPQRDISLLHSSSGTTGGPKLIPYTGGDIAKWAANTAFMLWIGGFRKGDVVVCAMPFGEFTGGGGLYLGHIALGATYIPLTVTPTVTDRIIAHITGQMRLGDRTLELDPLQRANAFVSLPGYIPRLVETLRQRGVAPQEIRLDKILTGGEPSSDALRERITEATGVRPRDIFGLGEFYGPGNAAECAVGDCLHFLSDDFLVEVIDPETGQPAAEGAMGELVITSLHKEAFPLLRYRTGDSTRMLARGCPCGLAHTRVARIPGRINADDIVLPGSIHVNRTFLENVLLRVEGTGAEYAVTVADHPSRPGLRRLHVAIEGDADRRDELARQLAERIQFEYNQKAEVTIVPWGTIPRAAGKARRVFAPDEFQQLVGSVGG